MKTRIISGVFLVIIGLITIITGGPVLAAVLLFCSIVGMYELDLALGVIEKGKPFPPAAWAGFAGACFYYVAMLLGGLDFCLPSAGLVFAAILAAYVLSFPKISSAQAIAVCFGFFYLAVMLSFIFLLRTGTHGETVVWLVFLSSWVADTCAYFAGRFFGKHRMAPVLSPKKTMEGAAGGIAGSVLAGVLFSVILENGRFNWQFALICGAGAVISIFGDLAASAIKRDRNIKDYGNLIPGHGGILDRFDSVIFTAPAIYFLSLLLVARGL